MRELSEEIEDSCLAREIFTQIEYIELGEFIDLLEDAQMIMYRLYCWLKNRFSEAKNIIWIPSKVRNSPTPSIQPLSPKN